MGHECVAGPRNAAVDEWPRRDQRENTCNVRFGGRRKLSMLARQAAGSTRQDERRLVIVANRAPTINVCLDDQRLPTAPESCRRCDALRKPQSPMRCDVPCLPASASDLDAVLDPL